MGLCFRTLCIASGHVHAAKMIRDADAEPRTSNIVNFLKGTILLRSTPRENDLGPTATTPFSRPPSFCLLLSVRHAAVVG